jgi:hypothetical protein
MAKVIGILEADQPLTAKPERHTTKVIAFYLVRKCLAVRIGKRLIQMVEVKAAQAIAFVTGRGWWDGPLGIGNVLPFSPPTDPGKHRHYKIPHAGDVGLRRHNRKLIRVSGRSMFSRQPIPCVTRICAS